MNNFKVLMNGIVKENQERCHRLWLKNQVRIFRIMGGGDGRRGSFRKFLL